jgi:hypothetical protein
MQISAHNMLLAAQQARSAQPAKPAPPQAFEPLPLKQTAAPAAQQTGTPAQRPGSQLDIRV